MNALGLLMTALLIVCMAAAIAAVNASQRGDWRFRSLARNTLAALALILVGCWLLSFAN